MATIPCLVPECGFVAEHDELETAKRIGIDHANGHAEATVMIACAHVVPEEAWVRLPDRTIQTPRGEHIERERAGVCKRCGNRLVESVAPLVSEEEITEAALETAAPDETEGVPV